MGLLSRQQFDLKITEHFVVFYYDRKKENESVDGSNKNYETEPIQSRWKALGMCKAVFVSIGSSFGLSC